MPMSAVLALLNDLFWNVSAMTNNIGYMHHIICDRADGGIGKER